MPQNPIQFQPGQSLVEFFALYGTEAQCEAALARGVCLSGLRRTGPLELLRRGAPVLAVRAVPHTNQPAVRDPVRATKLPLTKWFLAEYLIGQNRNDFSALSLDRHLGVSYRTAWRVKHKHMEAMAERESTRRLHRPVIADDAYLGGVHAGKPGRGSPNKMPFIAAVELIEEGHPWHVRLDALPNFKTAIRGTYHHFNFAKYRARYLAETQYRLNRRFDPASMVERRCARGRGGVRTPHTPRHRRAPTPAPARMTFA